MQAKNGFVLKKRISFGPLKTNSDFAKGGTNRETRINGVKETNLNLSPDKKMTLFVVGS